MMFLISFGNLSSYIVRSDKTFIELLFFLGIAHFIQE